MKHNKILLPTEGSRSIYEKAYFIFRFQCINCFTRIYVVSFSFILYCFNGLK